MLRFGGYLLRFNLASDWLRKINIPKIFSGVHGLTGKTVRRQHYLENIYVKKTKMVLTCEYCYKLVACKLQRKCNDETFYKMNKPDFKGLFKFIHVALAAAHMPLN